MPSSFTAEPDLVWRFRLQVLLATVFFCVFEIGLFSLQTGVLSAPEPEHAIEILAIRFVVLLGMCALAYACLEFAASQSIIAAIVAVIVGFIPFALLHAYVIRAVVQWLGFPVGEPGPLIFAADYWTQFMLVWSAGVLAAFYGARLQREQHLRREATTIAQRARMRTLRYRLNPHFLFNTLNSIGLLALEKQEEQAKSLIDRLSTFLRTSLQSDPSGYHSLEDEFAQLDDYLSIEQVRFPERLAYSLSLPEELREAAVPPFVLQPMIEGAITHGVSPARHPVTIAISARAGNGRVSIELLVSQMDGEFARHHALVSHFERIADQDFPEGYAAAVRSVDGHVAMALRAPLMIIGEEPTRQPETEETPRAAHA